MAVGWRRARAGASEAAIRELEERVGARLPAGYRAFLREHDGGEPADNEFAVGRDNDAGVDEFMSVAQIAEQLALSGGEHGPHRLPIAFAAGGNLVVVALDTGAVCFWDHEVDGPEAFTELARDVESFRNELQPFDPASVKLDPSKVKRAWIDPDLLR